MITVRQVPVEVIQGRYPQPFGGGMTAFAAFDGAKPAGSLLLSVQGEEAVIQGAETGEGVDPPLLDGMVRTALFNALEDGCRGYRLDERLPRTIMDAFLRLDLKDGDGLEAFFSRTRHCG